MYAQVGFSLCEGGVLVISGANGIGKTTLLRQLAGLETPEAGSIQWFNNSIKSCESYDHDMLYLGDTNALYPEFSVTEQLHYIARLWGDEARLEPTIHYMRLQPYLDHRIAELSAGWKRRVALCRLLLIPSLLWLLDEPMVHLDRDGAALLGGILHSHAEKGGMTVLTMPEMDSAPRIHNVPVSLLQLSDFTAHFEETP